MLECDSSTGGGHERYSDDRHILSKAFKTLDKAQKYAEEHGDMKKPKWNDSDRGKWSICSGNRYYQIYEQILGDDEIEDKPDREARHGMMNFGVAMKLSEEDDK